MAGHRRGRHAGAGGTELTRPHRQPGQPAGRRGGLDRARIRPASLRHEQGQVRLSIPHRGGTALWRCVRPGRLWLRMSVEVDVQADYPCRADARYRWPSRHGTRLVATHHIRCSRRTMKLRDAGTRRLAGPGLRTALAGTEGQAFCVTAADCDEGQYGVPQKRKSQRALQGFPQVKQHLTVAACAARHRERGSYGRDKAAETLNLSADWLYYKRSLMQLKCCGP